MALRAWIEVARLPFVLTLPDSVPDEEQFVYTFGGQRRRAITNNFVFKFDTLQNEWQTIHKACAEGKVSAVRGGTASIWVFEKKRKIIFQFNTATDTCKEAYQDKQIHKGDKCYLLVP